MIFCAKGKEHVTAFETIFSALLFSLFYSDIVAAQMRHVGVSCTFDIDRAQPLAKLKGETHFAKQGKVVISRAIAVFAAFSWPVYAQRQRRR